MFNVVGRDYLVGVGYGDGGARLILSSCEYEASNWCGRRHLGALLLKMFNRVETQECSDI